MRMSIYSTLTKDELQTLEDISNKIDKILQQSADEPTIYDLIDMKNVIDLLQIKIVSNRTILVEMFDTNIFERISCFFDTAHLTLFGHSEYESANVSSISAKKMKKMDKESFKASTVNLKKDPQALKAIAKSAESNKRSSIMSVSSADMGTTRKQTVKSGSKDSEVLGTMRRSTMRGSATMRGSVRSSGFGTMRNSTISTDSGSGKPQKSSSKKENVFFNFF